MNALRVSNNSHPNDLINIMNGLNKSIKMTIIVYWTVTFQKNVFHKAIQRLKFEKLNGVFNKLASEYFINAT